VTPLRWRPSPLALSLATSSATALVLAVLGHRPELLAFAAPLLGALAAGWWRSKPATRVTLRPERDIERCFENERLDLSLNVRFDGGGDDPDELTATLMPPAGLEVDQAGATEWAIRTTRWGRFTPPVELTVHAAGGLLVASAVLRPVEIRVYPRAAPLTAVPRPGDLPDRIGVHIGRRPGEGVEFAGIRPYVFGDPLGRVNWPVSARLGRLHVTQRLAERSADVVALVDTYAGRDETGLDLSVHGAAEVVQAALRRGDRAGVLALGGNTRWLGPEMGRRQFYRIADAVLDATDPAPATRSPEGRVPRAALPPRACVVAFTPLLDARVGLALQDVRRRGHAILVVDVLREPPEDDHRDPLVGRLWRLERRGLHRDLASVGIPVVAWAEWSTLDDVLSAPARRPLPSGRASR
jgi:uncharacterized protein (DUF58 family)